MRRSGGGTQAVEVGFPEDVEVAPERSAVAPEATPQAVRKDSPQAVGGAPEGGLM
jgi:hypothetical protein